MWPLKLWLQFSCKYSCNHNWSLRLKTVACAGLTWPPPVPGSQRVVQGRDRSREEMTKWEKYFAICGPCCREDLEEGGAFVGTCCAARTTEKQIKVWLENNHTATAWLIYITFHITFHIPDQTWISFHFKTSQCHLPFATKDLKPVANKDFNTGQGPSSNNEIYLAGWDTMFEVCKL